MPGVKSSQWAFALEGHGKGGCDGHGGRITAWLASLAKKQLINTLAKFCKALNNVAASAEKLSPGGSSAVFVAFTPPAKSKLPRCYVDTDSLRSDGAGIRSIYHWSFSLTGVTSPRPL